MNETFAQLMEPVARGLEAFGVLVILVSAILATITFLRSLGGEARKTAR